MIGDASGEERGEHQENLKNKEDEVILSKNQPSHTVSSKKDTIVDMEINTSLVASSIKDVTIKRVPNRGYRQKGKGHDQPKFTHNDLL